MHVFPHVPEVERAQPTDLHHKKITKECINTFKCKIVDYLTVRSLRVQPTVYQAAPVVDPKLLDVGTYSLAACQPDSSTRKLKYNTILPK